MECRENKKNVKNGWSYLTVAGRTSALQHDNVSARTDGKNDRGDSPTNEWGERGYKAGQNLGKSNPKNSVRKKFSKFTERGQWSAATLTPSVKHLT